LRLRLRAHDDKVRIASMSQLKTKKIELQRTTNTTNIKKLLDTCNNVIATLRMILVIKLLDQFQATTSLELEKDKRKDKNLNS